MYRVYCNLAILALGQSLAAHTDNPVFRGLLTEGIGVNGTKIPLPPPTLLDGLTAESARDEIRAVVGDERALNEFLRDSVTAPFVLKTRDVKAGNATVRGADVWFAIHGKLEEVDLDRTIRVTDEQKVEVANMRVESRRLGEQDLRDQKIELLPPRDRRREWYTHLTGRLLDRIGVEGTDRAIATFSDESIVVAARTERTFDSSTRYPNRWASLNRKGQAEITGPEQSYIGGASYLKVTRLPMEPPILFVEAHFVYVEPHEWFQGNPILRSKFGIIAQDQIRRLRPEIEKNRRPK